MSAFRTVKCLLFSSLLLVPLLAACGAGPVKDDGETSSSGDGDTASGDGDTDVIPDECEGDCEGSISSCTASVAGSAMLRRLTSRELTALINHTFPEANGKWTSSMSQDPVNELGFDNDAERLQVTKQTAKEIDATTESVGAAVVAQLGSILPCSTGAADRACANEFVEKYGRRLFRRPLGSEESEKYLAFFDSALSKTDFPTAVSWLTRALLHATPTLYRHELGVTQDGERKLTAFEIATELAFTFTGEPPSDALLDLAEAGGLDTREAVVEQAETLIRSPAGYSHLHRFFEASLAYSRVSTITKTTPGVNFTELRGQMISETRNFIETIVMERSGTVADLLTAPTSFPSKALATHYGWTAPASDYTEVERPSGQGIGVLAQGSILSGEAKPDSSSPTQRGLLVLEKLLCGELPEVPPNVPEVPEIQEGQKTTRQRYEEVHASGGACATCHAKFDPIGFGLEHFDEVGRFREDEFGLTIDSSSTVPRLTPEVSFTGQEELARGLAGRSEVGQCISSQLKSYVFATNEACLGEGQRDALSGNETGIMDYLISLAAEPHFTTRRK